VRRAWARGPSVQERAAGQWPEPMGEWSAESEALGLVQLKGRGVPGEVGRARVTCRCVTGLGESQRGKSENTWRWRGRACEESESGGERAKRPEGARG
jgi:hypothetical protein